jgi:hypothetical protein
MEKADMDVDTVANVRRRINELTEIIKGYQEELKDEENSHQKWNELQKKLVDFYNFCSEMLTMINDPEYTPSYKDKRDAIEFFGINAIITGTKDDPKVEVTVNPPLIVSLLT